MEDDVVTGKSGEVSSPTNDFEETGEDDDFEETGEDDDDEEVEEGDTRRFYCKQKIYI